MATRIHVFGKYPVTHVLQTLARMAWTKDEARRALAALGHGDVADNTIKTQFTDYKNPKYAKEEVRFTKQELEQLEKARRSEGEPVHGNRNGDSTFDELMRFKQFAKSFGGVQRVRKLCEVLTNLQE